MHSVWPSLVAKLNAKMSRRSEALPILTAHSTPAQPQALWASRFLLCFNSRCLVDVIISFSDFMLGAGAVIIQPSTSKVCIIEDFPSYAGQYFLPRGRKDVGESLEATALREAFEEVRNRSADRPT